MDEGNIKSSNIRIMVIDDEPGVVFSLKLMLEALGCDAHPYNSGVEALKALNDGQRFNAILCDLRMPEMDGFDVLKAVKQLGLTTPFILISGHATTEDVSIGQSLGIDGFLAKPFTPEEVCKVLEDIKRRE